MMIKITTLYCTYQVSIVPHKNSVFVIQNNLIVYLHNQTAINYGDRNRLANAQDLSALLYTALQKCMPIFVTKRSLIYGTFTRSHTYFLIH